MPVISDERRAERRMQILNAAWACFQRQGLHATTMNDIIRVSGLSAGAVYSYFKSKDDLIVSALTTSLSGVRDLLETILQRDPQPAPHLLVRDVVAAIEGFSVREEFDLKRLALLGWSEAQRNDRLRSVMRTFYSGFRDRLVQSAESWQRNGLVDQGVAGDIAKTIMALVLGYIVQATVLGDLTPEIIDSGLQKLSRLDAQCPRGKAGSRSPSCK